MAYALIRRGGCRTTVYERTREVGDSFVASALLHRMGHMPYAPTASYIVPSLIRADVADVASRNTPGLKVLLKTRIEPRTRAKDPGLRAYAQTRRMCQTQTRTRLD